MRLCFICSSDKKETLYDSSVVVPAPYPLSGAQSIVQCVRCGFIYSDSANTVANFEDYYTSLNKHKKRAADASSLDCAYFEKISLHLDTLNRSSKILDFGSGDLLMKEILLNMGFSDIQTYDIGGEQPSDKFDFIISTHAFEHIINADDVIDNLNAMLADNGQLLIAVPDVNAYSANYCGPYNYFDLEHINHFSLSSLKNLFLTNYFDVKLGLECSREVRPELFYPEVIVIGRKIAKSNKKPMLVNDIERSKLEITGYIELSEKDFSKSLATLASVKHKKRLMWGLGIWMMRIAYHSTLTNVSFIDSDPRLRGKQINGEMVLGPDDLSDQDLSNCVFVVAAVNSKDIVNTIRNKFGSKIEIFTL